MFKQKRGKRLKGGIDWARYKNMCEQKLYPFYREMEKQGRNVVVIEDGAGPHRAKAMIRHHQLRGIKIADWPASSPDLNPIERVWLYVRGMLAKREVYPKTKEEMKRAWVEEWNKIPVSLVNKFFEDVPKRCHGPGIPKGEMGQPYVPKEPQSICY